MIGVALLVLVGLMTSLAFPSDILTPEIFRRETDRENHPIMYIFMIWECFYLDPFNIPHQSMEETNRYYFDTVCRHKEDGFACLRNMYDEYKDELNSDIESVFHAAAVPDLYHSLDAIRDALSYFCQRKEFVLSKMECVRRLDPRMCGPFPGSSRSPTLERQPLEVICNQVNTTSKCYGRAARPCGAEMEAILVDLGEIMSEGCLDDFNQ